MKGCKAVNIEGCIEMVWIYWGNIISARWWWQSVAPQCLDKSTFHSTDPNISNSYDLSWDTHTFCFHIFCQVYLLICIYYKMSNVYRYVIRSYTNSLDLHQDLISCSVTHTSEECFNDLFQIGSKTQPPWQRRWKESNIFNFYSARAQPD